MRMHVFNISFFLRYFDFNRNRESFYQSSAPFFPLSQKEIARFFFQENADVKRQISVYLCNVYSDVDSWKVSLPNKNIDENCSEQTKTRQHLNKKKKIIIKSWWQNGWTIEVVFEHECHTAANENCMQRKLYAPLKSCFQKHLEWLKRW